MCGVMMQFFAVSRGLSARIGSVEHHVQPGDGYLAAVQQRPPDPARPPSAPRLLLRMITPSFILAMFSLLMMPTLKSAKGIWRASHIGPGKQAVQIHKFHPRSLAACDWERL